MGLRGPAPLPEQQLVSRFRRKKAREAGKKKPKPRRLKKAEARKISRVEWDRIIQVLPGYDPNDQAGDCKFSYVEAQRAVDFFETRLHHVKGVKARQPFLLERWQKALIGNLFGWKRPDKTRRYRDAFIFVPRKNGKSVIAAGIILYCLFEDGEPGAEIYGAASEFKQASLIFEHARGMVVQNDVLRERSTIYPGVTKAIQLGEKEQWGRYRVVAADSGSIHGFNSHVYIIDEVHALPNSDLIDTFETSTGARRQPLGVLISTSDFERPGSPCNEKHDYAGKVRDGIIDDMAFLPVIYEASLDDDWRDPIVWAKANPNMGVSLSVEYLEAACRKAVESPRFENTFKRLHLNIRTEQDVRWLPMDKWDSCAGEPVALEEFRGRTCCAGLDLATTRDLTAFVMSFLEEDGSVVLLPTFWIPKDTARERSRKDRVPYEQWIREGWIRTTEGNATDYAAVRRDINELVSEHGIDIRQIAADRLFQGEQICQELREQDGLDVMAFGQGFLSMAGPTKRFEEMVLQGNIRHGANPVLRWHASNVSVELDAAGNMKPSRKKSVEKIDGIVASIMGMHLTLLDGVTSSDYNVLEPIVLDF